MIAPAGSPIQGTVWFVRYQHPPLEPGPGTPPLVAGDVHVVTADPSGADIYQVTRAAVLNGRADSVPFTLLEVRRCTEVKGRALVSGAAAAGSN